MSKKKSLIALRYAHISMSPPLTTLKEGGKTSKTQVWEKGGGNTKYKYIIISSCCAVVVAQYCSNLVARPHTKLWNRFDINPYNHQSNKVHMPPL